MDPFEPWMNLTTGAAYHKYSHQIFFLSFLINVKHIYLKDPRTLRNFTFDFSINRGQFIINFILDWAYSSRNISQPPESPDTDFYSAPCHLNKAEISFCL